MNISPYMFFCVLPRKHEQHHHYYALIVFVGDALKAFLAIMIALQQIYTTAVHIPNICVTTRMIKTRKRNFQHKIMKSTFLCMCDLFPWNHRFDTGRKNSNPPFFLTWIFSPFSVLANFLAKMHFQAHKFSKIRLLFDRKAVHQGALMTSSPFFLERNRRFAEPNHQKHIF